MLESLKKISPSFKALEKEVLSSKNCFLIDALSYSQKALIISYLKNNLKKNILVITNGEKEDFLFENLLFFEKEILEFPYTDSFFKKNTSINSSIVGKRIQTLLDTLKNKKSIILSPFQAVLQKTISKKGLKKAIFEIKKNSSISFSKLPKTLFSLGYKREAVVENKGEFAIRGGIIDLFSPKEEFPSRLEFFENKVETIRTFDISSQRTLEKKEKIEIFPADEQKIINEEKDLYKDKTFSFLDFLEDFIIFFDSIESLEDSYISLKNISYHKQHFISLNQFFEKIKTSTSIFLEEEKIEKISAISKRSSSLYFEEISFEFLQKSFIAKKLKSSFLKIPEIPVPDKTFEKYPFSQIKTLLKENFSIFFISETKEEENFIKKHLLENSIKISKNISFKRGFLSSGFLILDTSLAYIPYFEFSKKIKLRRQQWQSSSYKKDFSSANLINLNKNDLVVHQFTGIGKYLGIEKQKNHVGKEAEFLTIEYKNKSKLFVPISQSYLVSKYIGKKEERPKIDILGSSKWKKTKLTAQKNIVGYAKELLELYAKREVKRGFVYKEDSEELKLFEHIFEYEETKDQLKAILDIKSDLKTQKPMERLILGDAGYGKTEVAMRACFKVVWEGKKQVAMLVPTTILAMQHFETFKERMQEFPIIIEHISRFNPPKKNKEILLKAQEGKVDILIGTHRILSKDVSFKDLGLIVIDEEQRFGVRAKEHLKKFKSRVDSLSLSATPIPRTLYLSLIKVRSISLISTPPKDRLPIKTILIENDDKVIKNAILRELSQEGQVFFIHNRVESIEKRSSYIQNLIPNGKILYVHGQMASNEIDSAFHSFKNKEANILFSTTIVENGIDIPTCNTIIIDNAQNFGLADLYQLRGRVGRWNKEAFCYLIIPKNKKLSKIAKMRISSIVETSCLSSGMQVALKDLEIRGAGDILGTRQSGNISAIGFHLYLKMLKKALDALKNKKPINFLETKIDSNFPSKIPEYYILETSLRMDFYNKIGSSISFSEIDQIQEEIIDRFGKLPKETLYLLNLAKIKIFASMNKFHLLRFEKFTLFAKKESFSKFEEKTFPLPLTIQKDPEKLKKYTLEVLKKNFKHIENIF